MARNMSFFLTTPQIKARTKTVTRRFGWWFLKSGDIVSAVRQAQGLKKGEKIERLATIQIIDSRAEPLTAITQEDCVKEGFPNLSPDEFVEMIVRHYKLKSPENSIVNRIEFRYV